MNCDLVKLRRIVMKQAIHWNGGAYITPEENHQPDPGLRIASITLGGITGLGQTEALAQNSWFRQNAAKSQPAALFARVPT